MPNAALVVPAATVAVAGTVVTAVLLLPSDTQLAAVLAEGTVVLDTA
jgi:hypothetical protein